MAKNYLIADRTASNIPATQQDQGQLFPYSI